MKIFGALYKTSSDSKCLKLETYSINTIMGPKGICPMLLVFGAITRPAHTTPSPSQLSRDQEIYKAIVEVEKLTSRRGISFDIKHTAGPKGRDVSHELRKLPAGSPVLVYRKNKKGWCELYRFVSVDGETAVIQTSRECKIFRLTCVKPYTKSDMEENNVLVL